MDSAVFAAFADELKKQAAVPAATPFFQRVGGMFMGAAGRFKPTSGIANSAMSHLATSNIPQITNELTRAGRTFTAGQVGTMAGERALSTIGKGVVGTAVAVPVLAGAGYMAGRQSAPPPPRGYAR
jgi:hypothetical protein